MSDGLKRAAAAAARSRWDGALTDEMRRFLKALDPDRRPITSVRIPVPCTEKQNQARARCRKLGLARMAPDADGKRGWQLTDEGAEALSSSNGA